jgi:RimJ/RimL family protein N-acetyltransferase
MAAAISTARTRPGLLVLTLTLTEGNEHALRLYRSLGFETWGIEPMAIRTSAGFKGKVHMSLRLPQPAGSGRVPPSS